ncbi:MAG: phosphoribosylanthranilate isomerase [Roseomonas sp.]|nr:phosphoribosylanthranilate isomerase [Roseomonas sp.]MCA3406066.1 phosphoribosylanthranilate isomerase [Roseomonas sp.]
MLVKICGIKDTAALDAARQAGADMVGFVFFPPSPRAVTANQAGLLARSYADGPKRVGLFVDPDDAMLAAILAEVPLDILQLQGEETPARAGEIRARFGKPVMKALGIGSKADLARLPYYADQVDYFLLDAPPPAGSALPGGNAQAFDWALMKGERPPRPWLLAGGLTPANVVEAIAASGAPGVDVSSGVERARGIKDPAAITAFIAAAKSVRA